MRIRLLRNLGEGYPPYKLNQTVDCEEKLAESLVSRGLAEAVTVKAVPSSPAIGQRSQDPVIRTTKQAPKPKPDKEQ